MTVGLGEYQNFLSKFIELASPCVDKNINEIKHKYKNEINSIRSYEKINNLRSLIEILEKRIIVQYDKIEELKYIQENFIKEKSSEKLILEYDAYLKENSAVIQNLYTSGKPLETQSNNLHQNVFSRYSEKSISNNETEEICLETLLPEKSPSINFNHTQSSNTNIFSIITIEKIYKRFIEKKNTILFIIIILLLIVLLYIISIFGNMFHEAAILKSTSNQFGANMTHYTSNFNMSVSSETRFTTSLEPNDQEKNLQELVVKQIGEQIGNRYWRDVARKLKIKESVINKLESDHFRVPGGAEIKFKKAMDIYFSTHPQNWKYELVEALEFSRRRDLKELVEKILLTR